LQDWIADLTPQYWQFWIGLVLVVIVLIGRERMHRWIAAGRALVSRFGAWIVTPAALGKAAPDGN
jgi:branched-chain amino acid transport system permease protein